MNIVTNESLIKRNAKIGQFGLLGGLLVSATGVYVSFTYPERVGWLFSALLVGYAISQIGIYFTNRWGRRPRPDELLNKALKGLDRSYTIYHYSTPASHVLVGPAGVWVFIPKYQRGTMVYEKGRWRQKGGGLLLAYMRVFAQEGIGRPDLEIKDEVQVLGKYLKQKLGEDAPEIRAALVFTSPNATVLADDAPVPTLKVDDLKKFIRDQAKRKRMGEPLIQAVNDALS